MSLRIKSLEVLAALILLSGMFTGCIYITEDKQNGSAVVDSLMPTDSLNALNRAEEPSEVKDTAIISSRSESVEKPGTIDTKGVAPERIVAFAKTLIGTPYLYRSSNPAYGFDCSGFITYVFRNFGISVPRSSIDFTNVGKTVPLEVVRAGDLILFTGTDSTERFVGHMGIIVSNEADQVEFIHSTSGRQHGVTITPMSDYYKSRYVKTVRVFPE